MLPVVCVIPALSAPPLEFVVFLDVVMVLDVIPELAPLAPLAPLGPLAPLAPPTAVPMVPPEAQLSRTSQGRPGMEESFEFSPATVYTIGPAESEVPVVPMVPTDPDLVPEAAPDEADVNEARTPT